MMSYFSRLLSLCQVDSRSDKAVAKMESHKDIEAQNMVIGYELESAECLVLERAGDKHDIWKSDWEMEEQNPVS